MLLTRRDRLNKGLVLVWGRQNPHVEPGPVFERRVGFYDMSVGLPVA